MTAGTTKNTTTKTQEAAVFLCFITVGTSTAAGSRLRSSELSHELWPNLAVCGLRPTPVPTHLIVTDGYT